MGQTSAGNNLLAPTLTFNTGTLVGLGTGLTVSGSVHGYNCNLTVDTGSDISIVHPDILQDQKVEIQPVTPCFRTVTGQRAPMKGRCNLTARIGSTKSPSLCGSLMSKTHAYLAPISWNLWDVW